MCSLCLLTWQSLHLSPPGELPWHPRDHGDSCGWSRALQEQNQEIFPIKWGMSCLEVALTPDFWLWVFGQETQQLFQARASPLHCDKQGIKATLVLPKCIKIITAAREILSNTGASVLNLFKLLVGLG